MNGQVDYSKSYLARHYAKSLVPTKRTDRETSIVLFMFALIIVLIGARALGYFSHVAF